MDENNEIVLNENGEQLKRPGGHGGLIHNLNSIEAGVVFIKNIDNVAHERFRRMTTESKQMLGVVLLEIRGELLSLHTQVAKGLVDAVSIDQVRDKWNL